LSAIEDLKSRPIVLMCKTQKRSAAGAALLRDAGFEQVSVLRGGMANWKLSGYPVETQRAA
jgi:rhodanese-related sulfurtransferase